MSLDNIQDKVDNIVALKDKLNEATRELLDAIVTTQQSSQSAGVDPVLFGITVLVLACFVGYYVVWRVTPALHSPLMGVTNAISSVIIVGALIAAGTNTGISQSVGFFAVLFASINIFGGFIITHRMLAMFKKKGDK